jgi:hypothetical protein
LQVNIKFYNDLQTRLTSNSASRSAGFFAVNAGTYASSDENTYVMALKCTNNIQHGLRCDTIGLQYDVTNTTTQSTNFTQLLPWSLTEFKNTMTGGNAYGHPNLYNGPTASADRNDYLVIGSSFVRNDITPNQFYRSELKAYKDGLNFNYYDSAGAAVASWLLPYTRGRINTKLVFNRTGISLDFQGTTLAFILIGFCQNIGNVFMAVSISNGTIVSKKDLLTGADWSSPALTISFSGTTLTLSSNSDGFNYVSLFGDGISDAYI